VLPTLLRMCAAIDQLFIVEVGPFGRQLAEDARAVWLDAGNRLRPADVEHPVVGLRFDSRARGYSNEGGER